MKNRYWLNCDFGVTKEFGFNIFRFKKNVPREVKKGYWCVGNGFQLNLGWFMFHIYTTVDKPISIPSIFYLNTVAIEAKNESKRP